MYQIFIVKKILPPENFNTRGEQGEEQVTSVSLVLKAGLFDETVATAYRGVAKKILEDQANRTLTEGDVVMLEIGNISHSYSTASGGTRWEARNTIKEYCKIV